MIFLSTINKIEKKNLSKSFSSWNNIINSIKNNSIIDNFKINEGKLLKEIEQLKNTN